MNSLVGLRYRKILLVNPPAMARGMTPHPPMGLAYLASSLEARGYEVGILDTMALGWERARTSGWDKKYVGLDETEISDAIAAYGPDVIGVQNNFTSQHAMPHLVFKLAKQINREIVTITGGAHATVSPETCLQDRNLDYVILGEGELSLVNLLDYLINLKSIDQIDGIAFRKEAEIIIVEQTVRMMDLDQLPFPARHLLNLPLYWNLGWSHGRRRGTRFTPIVTSRGCSCGCTFCSYHRVTGKRFRPRSPENVVEEIRSCVENYQVDEITFEDDNLILNPQRAEKIFDMMIAEDFGLKWEVPNGVAAFALSKKLLRKMRDSGCYRVNFAIESGNQYVLDNLIKKPLKLNKVPELVAYCRDLGIETQVFLVVGTPGETREQIWDSFRFARKLGIYEPFVSTCMPLVGSEVYRVCKENGYFDEDFSFDRLSLEEPCFSTPSLSSSDLKRIVQDGRRFFIRAALFDNPLSKPHWRSFLATHLPESAKKLVRRVREAVPDFLRN
jgi:anaerobic magnesium-protoporphyrin IX monomethyl ester cyclase